MPPSGFLDTPTAVPLELRPGWAAAGAYARHQAAAEASDSRGETAELMGVYWRPNGVEQPYVVRRLMDDLVRTPLGAFTVEVLFSRVGLFAVIAFLSLVLTIGAVLLSGAMAYPAKRKKLRLGVVLGAWDRAADVWVLIAALAIGTLFEDSTAGSHAALLPVCLAIAIGALGCLLWWCFINSAHLREVELLKERAITAETRRTTRNRCIMRVAIPYVCSILAKVVVVAILASP